jgi:hypothetical protein
MMQGSPLRFAGYLANGYSQDCLFDEAKLVPLFGIGVERKHQSSCKLAAWNRGGAGERPQT